jgi:hypothetical protein
MTMTYPGGNNTFIPSFESSGKLVTDFSRNISTFNINKWAALIKVSKRVGYFQKREIDESVRTSANGAEWLWADGMAAGDNYIEQGFEWAPYACRRYQFPFSLGDQAVSQAEWSIVASYAATAASIAMTLRTKLALAKLVDPTLMTQTNTATALGGAKWDVGTVAAPAIKYGLMAAVSAIHKATNGVVQPSNLALLINPNTAVKMAKSAEVHGYMSGSPFSLPLMTNNLVQWGLPDSLYGIKIIVEDAVRVTSQKKQARTDEYCLPDQTAVLVARPGEIIQVDGTFATLGLFSAEELSVETRYEPDNRRTLGRVVEDFDVQVVSPISGYLITAVCA